MALENGRVITDERKIDINDSSVLGQQYIPECPQATTSLTEQRQIHVQDIRHEAIRLTRLSFFNDEADNDNLSLSYYIGHGRADELLFHLTCEIEKRNMVNAHRNSEDRMQICFEDNNPTQTIL
jgi:hypothetical protein